MDLGLEVSTITGDMGYIQDIICTRYIMYEEAFWL